MRGAIFVLAIFGFCIGRGLSKDPMGSSDTCDATSDLCRAPEKTGTTVRRPPCRMFDANDVTKDSPTILFGEARGRLGNQLLGYALLLQLKRQLGVESYMDSNMKNQLLEVFTEDSLELPVLDEVFCNHDRIRWSHFRGHIRTLLTDKGLRKGKVLKVYSAVKPGSLEGGYRPEEHICQEQEDFQKAYVSYLRERLKFRPHLQAHANKVMRRIAKDMGRKPKDVTFVGIHNRRTDYLKFALEQFQQAPLEADYFEDAMDHFREDYENVAFVYVSDDMEWGRKNLVGFGDLYFSGVAAGSTQEDDGDSVEHYFVENSAAAASAAADFVLLANCNNTIVTRGTFSLWASLLSGGEYYTEYGPVMSADQILESGQRGRQGPSG